MGREIKKSGNLKQLFCKHEYHEGTLQDPQAMFHRISGETYTTICTKCGKIKGTRFVEYEGSGFK